MKFWCSWRLTKALRLGTVSVLSLGVTLTVSAAGVSLPEGSTASRGTLQTVVQAIGTYQDLQQTIKEKQIALSFEEKLTFPSLVQIERLEKEIGLEEFELGQLQTRFAGVINRSPDSQFDESDELLVEGLIRDQRAKIAALQAEKAEFETTYQTRKDKQQTNIRTLRQELEDLQEEVEKQKSIIGAQWQRFLLYLAFFVALAVVFVGLKWLGRWLINRRFEGELTEGRRQALHKLNNLVFNGLLTLVVLGAVFSQLVNFLPFLAILGTGLAFAVRDTISSFIAWFVIGTERGYRSGDVIQIGDMIGQVAEIKPLLTALHELTPGWNTGRMVTVPNKIIFEDKIYNFSRAGGLQQETVEFLLTENSDIEKAKTLLLDIITEHTKDQAANLQKALKQNQALPKYTLEDLQPLVWVECTVHGLEIKGRFFSVEENSEKRLHRLQETFTKVVQKDKKVHFQFVEIGRQSRNSSHRAGEEVTH